MKTFSDFLLEYRGSRASEKAYRLGLVSNKHGGWVDRSGKLIAQTVKGDLQFIQKKSPSPEKQEAKQEARTKRESPTIKNKPATVRRGITPPAQQEDPPEIEGEKIITIVLGRFNPPTVGHKKLFDKAKQVATNGELRIYPSRAQNRTTDPLNPPQKIKYMRKMFPDLKKNIVNDRSLKTIFDVLRNIYEDGFRKVNIVAGADRISEFDRLSKQYNNTDLYDFEEINIISAGQRDPDSTDDITSMSSAKLRKAAIQNKYAEFRAGIPRSLPPQEVENLFHAVQNALEGKNKITEMWKVAPKLEYNTLREQYYQNNIFNVGDMVESFNNGLVGKVTRRGPNYVICVTEDNMMFKSWIKDITEWTDISGVPSDQRLVGTDAYREYAMKMTGTKKILNFLNNYRKSKNKTK
jgi:nicotinic acid mononucleotide adenylyltransferase